MSDYELVHYGVKGMKWGVRKKRWSEDAKTASSIRKKKVKEMSNAELRKLNERTQLENQYRGLNPSLAKRGFKFVASAAAVTGTVLSLHSNAGKLINLGKGVGDKFIDKYGPSIIGAAADMYAKKNGLI